MLNTNESSQPATEPAAPSTTVTEEVGVSNAEDEGTDEGAATMAASAKKAPPKKVKDPKAAEFLDEQRTLLLEERASYTRQAEELKAEADSLALEHEPGDVQFDEEGGEGGTSNVDRELDLVLSAQARGAVVEIDRALAKIDIGNYGVCEQCGQPIPHARLKALPYAALCVGCKSGGLSRR
jgi:DnaK suppressor protein